MVDYRVKSTVYWEKNYIFNSFFISKLINRFIIGGNKVVVEREFYIYMKALKKLTNYPLLLIFSQIQGAIPLVGLKKIKSKVRGSKKEGLLKIWVPIAITRARGLKIVLKWFRYVILTSVDLSKKPLRVRLYITTIAFSFKKKSKLLNIKRSTYQIAHTNRFAVHFRWK